MSLFLFLYGVLFIAALFLAFFMEENPMDKQARKGPLIVKEDTGINGLSNNNRQKHPHSFFLVVAGSLYPRKV